MFVRWAWFTRAQRKHHFTLCWIVFKIRERKRNRRKLKRAFLFLLSPRFFFLYLAKDFPFYFSFLNVDRGQIFLLGRRCRQSAPDSRPARLMVLPPIRLEPDRKAWTPVNNPRTHSFVRFRDPSRSESSRFLRAWHQLPPPPARTRPFKQSNPIKSRTQWGKV